MLILKIWLINHTSAHRKLISKTTDHRFSDLILGLVSFLTLDFVSFLASFLTSFLITFSDLTRFGLFGVDGVATFRRLFFVLLLPVVSALSASMLDVMSITRLLNDDFAMHRLVDFCCFLISFNAATPGLLRCFIVVAIAICCLWLLPAVLLGLTIFQNLLTNLKLSDFESSEEQVEFRTFFNNCQLFDLIISFWSENFQFINYDSYNLWKIIF